MGREKSHSSLGGLTEKKESAFRKASRGRRQIGNKGRDMENGEVC